MPTEPTLVVAGVVVSYWLLSRWLARWQVTAPMFAVVAGALLALGGRFIDLDTALVEAIAEVALVMVLFHDASTVRLRPLGADPWIAVRLLAIGFPLALVMTTAVVAGVLPAVGIAGALLIAGTLTPTDAGLGAPTVLNPVVPVRVRRALNVESGLNDGLATPVVLLAIGLLTAEEGARTGTALSMSLLPVVLAVLLAVVVGFGGARLLDLSRQHDWSTGNGRAVVLLGTPFLVLGLAELIGANTFISAFLTGLLLGSASTTLDEEHAAAELLETGAELVGVVVWFLGGLLLVEVVANGFEPVWLLLSLLILTALRIVPVWLSMLGLGLTRPTIGFLGWFGPRGLASIVFALVALEELGSDHPVMGPLAGVTACTVVISVFAHGISAGPLSQRYGDWVARTHPPIERLPGDEPRPSRGRPAHLHRH